MKKSLTDLTVQKLKAGVYFDTKTPAFGIRVGKRRKTWIITKGRERSVLTIGHYPALSLGDARRKALIALGSPLVSQTHLTFPEALTLFLGQSKWRPRSKKVLESSLRHFTWTRPLAKITHEDVAQAIEAVKSPSARAHALKDIRSFFNWCVPRYLLSSPAQGLKMAPQKARSRVLTDDELKRVWIAAETMGYPFGTIVMLLILTGQRKSEIGSLQWSWIQKDRIVLSRLFTKNGREHTFPLGQLSASLLSAISPKTNSSTSSNAIFLATTSTSKSYNGWAFHLKQLQKQSGTSGWTLHDLRRSFATGLASLNVPIHVTEKILNHVSGTTGGLVSVYQVHSYWPEQVAALKAWEERVISIVR